jgi:hypothetical protein
MGLFAQLGLKPPAAKAPAKAGPAAAAAADLARRAEAKQPLDAIVNQITALVLGGLDDIDGRDRINAELTKLNARIAKVDAVKDLKTATKLWQALTTPAQELLTRALETKKVVDWVRANYMPMIVPAQAAINGVPLASAKAALQKAYDGLEADRERLEAAMDLTAIQTIVFPVMQKLHKVSLRIRAAATESEKELARLGKQLEALGAAATKPLQDRLKALQQERKTTWPAGASLDEIEKSVASFDNALKVLGADVGGLAERQPAAIVDKQRRTLEKTLKSYDETAYSFVDHDKRRDATTKGFALKKKLDEAVAVKDTEARGRAYSALQREMNTKLTALKKVAFKVQMTEKGGAKEIDQMIAAMDSATDNPADIAACEAAIEARFGIDLKVPPDQMQKKTLPRLYKMLAKVPEWQAKQSKLKELDFKVEPGKGSYYQDGKISLNEIEPTEGGSVKRPDVDPDGSKEVKANYFDFTTLHEVGHAVDDKIGFTTQRMGTAAFGGWKEESLESVLEWIGEKSGFYNRYSGAPKPGRKEDVQRLLRTFLTTKACTKPADASKPMGSLLPVWDVVVNDPIVAACVDGMTVGDKPWKGAGTKAAKVVVANRCCHEAYPGNWVSYEFGARASTGISDYQWRAPGEWFAEIYALYYLDKLQNSHPMYAWFADAAKDEKKASIAPKK